MDSILKLSQPFNHSLKNPLIIDSIFQESLTSHEFRNPRIEIGNVNSIPLMFNLGITMPKAWFFENAFIPRKALVEVKVLQKVFSKHIYEI